MGGHQTHTQIVGLIDKDMMAQIPRMTGRPSPGGGPGIVHAWAVMCVLFSSTLLAQTPPGWWDNPIREDPAHYFFAATADSPDGEEGAIEAAREQALALIARRMGISADSDRERIDAVTSRIRNWNLHAKEAAGVGQRTRVWIILRYPKEEYTRLEEWISGGERDFGKARELASSAKYTEALDLLSQLVITYPPGAQPFLNTEEVLLLAGDCAMASGQVKRAMTYFQRVLDLGSDHPLFPRARQGYLSAQERHDPDEEWKSRFRGKTVSALISIEQDGGFRRLRSGLLTQLLGQIGLQHRETSPSTAMDMAALVDWVDKAETEVGVAFLVRLGEAKERRIYGNAFYVYPVTCEVILKVDGKDGTRPVQRKTVFFEASDRHERKEVIEHIIVKNCVSVFINLLKQHSNSE